MKILALDSTTRSACAALCEDDCCLAKTTLDAKHTHSETLLPMIAHLCELTHIPIAEMDAFAVTVGPGSFTGVRIGVSTIKGLAFGQGKPCYAISTLEALAQNAAGLSGILVPVLDARRSQVYSACFRSAENGTVQRLTEDDLLPIPELVSRLAAYGEPIRLFGDAADSVSQAAQAQGIPLLPVPSLLRAPDAASVAYCAYTKIQAHEAPLSDVTLAPVYLRPSQAERERAERVAAQSQKTEASVPVSSK